MSANQTASLDLEGVSRRFGDRVVLSDVTLAIPPGRITCLLGESGCGKSTLLRIIAGVDRPDGGRIRMSGTEIVGPGRFVQPESRRIGFMFQDYALFPHLSVAENLAFGLRHLPKAAQRDRVAEVVGRIGQVTLNRPSAINALDHDMARAMHAALRAWASDPAVDAVVVSSRLSSFIPSLHHPASRGTCPAREAASPITLG